MGKYNNSIITEIGAHDHWADARVFDNSNLAPIRSLYVAAGVSPQLGQLPGYTTMKISNGVAEDIVVTSMDITSVYGQSSVPPIQNVPIYNTRF